MNNLYDDYKKDFLAMGSRNGLYRASEGDLAGQVLQFSGVSSCAGKTNGFILMFSLTTERLERVPFDIAELVKYKCVYKKDLAPREQEALDKKIGRFQETAAHPLFL